MRNLSLLLLCWLSCIVCGLLDAKAAIADAAATLDWTAPTTNTDDSPLTDLLGYNIFRGTDPNNLTFIKQVFAPVTHWVTPDLQPIDTTWFFAVTAFNVTGGESVRSNIAAKTLGGSPPPPPPPPDPCVVAPLAKPTGLAWPTARTGYRTIRWSSPAKIVRVTYTWPIGGTQTLTITDERGCSATVTKP